VKQQMEVHHHPHAAKGFKGYFLEFLMIFLAVTLGFFAEGFREHLIDKKKEREFIGSLKEDLVTDSASLRDMIPAGHIQFEKLDSLYTLLQLTGEGKPVDMHRLYYLNFMHSFGLLYFEPNKRTISQIKSTGAFALIRNKACKDSITVYDLFNEIIKANADDYKDWLVDLNTMSQKIFSYDRIKTFGFFGSADVFLNDSLTLKLVNSDKLLLSEYANKVRSVMMILDILLLTEQKQFMSCKNLISLLNKEYHLK